MILRRVLLGLSMGAVVGMLPGVAQATSAGSHVVVVVVDFADGTHQSLVGCVKEPQGATDAQALADVLRSNGAAQSRFSSSGLLCGIDNVPSSGCGVETQAGYQYWAYFHGSASKWRYANDGPAEHVAVSNEAVGFRFEPNGKGNPTDLPPSESANQAVLCQGVTTVSSSTVAQLTTHTSSSIIPVGLALGAFVVILGGAVLLRRRTQ